MGIFSRKAPPPTAVDLGNANNPSTQSTGDPEKADKDVQLEDTPAEAHARSIDPELERRVVRKLDWHVPPLVAFLCECGHRNSIAAGHIGSVEWTPC